MPVELTFQGIPLHSNCMSNGDVACRILRDPSYALLLHPVPCLAQPTLISALLIRSTCSIPQCLGYLLHPNQQRLGRLCVLQAHLSIACRLCIPNGQQQCHEARELRHQQESSQGSWLALSCMRYATKKALRGFCTRIGYQVCLSKRGLQII